MPKQFAQRIADVDWLQITRHYLVKHWGEETEVISADEGHLDTGPLSRGPIQVSRGLDTSKSTTQDNDLRFSGLLL
jgi:hypothetical protein